MKTVINEMVLGTRTFTVVYDQERYMAIEDKYIDENGCLKQELNGLQTCASKTLDECIRRMNERVRIDALEEAGYTMEEAMMMVFGVQMPKNL